MDSKLKEVKQNDLLMSLQNDLLMCLFFYSSSHDFNRLS